jgi:aryl-alcohol dehydrogenase-like predicted oxidoreductase
MEKRKLGKSGIEIAPLGFGANVFGWTADKTQSYRLLDAWLAAGFNFVDTADVYSVWVPGNSGGESETILGSWMKERKARDKVIVATKVGMEMGPGRKGLSRPYIMAAVEDSLRRLQTDYIDLYQSHIDDETIPLEETLATYADLILAGKVRAIGASNYGAARLADALTLSERQGLPRYESLQLLYNLYDRSPFEGAIEQLCLARDIGVLSYFSLASGFLTGKYRREEDLASASRGERVRSYMNARGTRILAALDTLAAEYAASPAQIALAWILARPSITAPLASATSETQLHDLLKATRLELGRDSLAHLDHASRA